MKDTLIRAAKGLPAFAKRTWDFAIPYAIVVFGGYGIAFAATHPEHDSLVHSIGIVLIIWGMTLYGNRVDARAKNTALDQLLDLLTNGEDTEVRVNHTYSYNGQTLDDVASRLSALEQRLAERETASI